MNSSRERKAACCVLIAYAHAKHLIVRPTFARSFVSFLGCYGRDSDDVDAMLFEVAIELAVLNATTADRKTLMQLSNAGQTGEKTLSHSQQNLSRFKFDESG